MELTLAPKERKSNLFAFVLLLICSITVPSIGSYAQVPHVQWAKTEGPHGGSFRVINADPNTENIWGRVGKDVYVSTDTGNSWSHQGVVDALFAAFSFRSDGAIFAGPYLSYDQGASWKKTNLPDSVYIRGMAIDETTNQVVAASEFGIYYSADDGENWVQADTRSVDDVWAAGNGYVFAKTQRKPQVLLRSSDGGRSWTEPSTPEIEESLGFFHKGDSLSFLLTFNYSPEGSRLYRSLDYGDSWEPLAFQPCGKGDLLGFTPEGELIVLDSASGVYKLSADFQQCEIIFDDVERTYPLSGGKTWSRIKAWTLNNQGVLLVYSGFGQLLSSEDLGQSWQLREMHGIVGTSVHSILVEPQHGTVFSGTRNKGLFRSENHGQQWTYEGFSSQAISVMAAGGRDGELWLNNHEEGLYRSVDYGQTWSYVDTGIRLPIWKIQYHPATEILYVHSIYDIYYSRDGGETWDGMNAQYKSTVDPPITGMIVAPNGTVYTVIRDDILADTFGMYRTADFGTTWEKIDTYPIRPSHESIMLFDSAGRLWTAEGTALYVSDDEGVTWEERTPPGNGGIYDILETPDGSLWIAHGWGLLRSIDGGKSWREEHDNLGDLCVLSLAWNDAESELILGTHGGGVYRGHIDVSIRVDIQEESELPAADLPVDLKSYPNPTVNRTTISFNVPYDGPVRITLYDVLGRELDELLSRHVLKGNHEVIVDMNRLPVGLYFYRLETPSGTYSKSIVRID